MLLLIGIDGFVIELWRVMDGWGGGGGAAATVALEMTVTTVKTYWYLWC